MLSEMGIAMGENTFLVYLSTAVKKSNDEGVFQLSHEVVHLISPVLMEDHEEVNFLEEGMAVHFSKMVTEPDTGNFTIADICVDKKPIYRLAYQLYLELIKEEPDAIKKLRKIQSEICRITPETFMQVGLKTSPELIGKLLAHFPRH